MWGLISALAFVDFLDGVAVPPGQLTAWAVLIAAVATSILAWRFHDVAGARGIATVQPARSDTLHPSPIH
jgi:hypothetical protein